MLSLSVISGVRFAPLFPLSLGILVAVYSARPTAPARLTVNLATLTGPVSHGAAGWLYGQSQEGIPTENVMAPLKPEIAAQKPIGGLQHPGGDDLLVEPSFRRAGGRAMQIYMQDIYPDWPYDNLGIGDYLQKVEAIARRVAADKNRDQFVYVPFNEPNNNWYSYSGPLFDKFLSDWKAVYEKIRSVDPQAKIAGPGYEKYNTATYKAFLTFARDHNVLPAQLTWHELDASFFTEWYRRVADFRSLERQLGIGPLPIVINEYTRPYGDLTEPGQLVQWIARFEDSKVAACLAFWNLSGSLSDLVSKTWPNRATGGWWVYEWYGAMSGETVAVTPPDRNAEGLNGVATIDKSRKQARVILGGVEGPVSVLVEGLETSAAHAALWRVDPSGTEPSDGPVMEQEKNFSAAQGDIEVIIPLARRRSAYYLIVTAGKGPETASLAGRYEAEYAGSPSEFVVTVPSDGYYNVVPRTSAAAPIEWQLNGRALGEIHGARRVFLAGGINRIAFPTAVPRVDAIDLTPASGPIANYEAESKANSLGGTAAIVEDGAAWGDKLVTAMGQGAGNYLQFNHVLAGADGTYRMIVSYSNNQQGHSGQVERYADIAVNGGPPKQVYFRNTFDWSVFRTVVVDVRLQAGANTIRFSNAAAPAPNIDRISIAAPLLP